MQRKLTETQKNFIVLNYSQDIANLIGVKFRYINDTYPQGIPFNIIGLGDTREFPLKVQTWEGRCTINGRQKLCSKMVSDHRESTILNMIKELKLIKIN